MIRDFFRKTLYIRVGRYLAVIHLRPVMYSRFLRKWLFAPPQLLKAKDGYLVSLVPWGRQAYGPIP